VVLVALKVTIQRCSLLYCGCSAATASSLDAVHWFYARLWTNVF